MFRIPNPVKRAIRNSKDEHGCLYEVLFSGADKDLLFFMEQESAKDAVVEEGFYFNCIDMDKIAANNKNKINFTSAEILAESVKFQIRSSKVTADSLLHKYLKSFKLENLNEDYEKLRAAHNPIFIAEDGGYKIIFHLHTGSSSMTEEDADETQNKDTFALDSERKDDEDDTSRIYLYEFKEGQTETKERFLAAAQILVGYSKGKIYYLKSLDTGEEVALIMKERTSVNENARKKLYS
jgi:hypothetical protein